MAPKSATTGVTESSVPNNPFLCIEANSSGMIQCALLTSRVGLGLDQRGRRCVQAGSRRLNSSCCSLRVLYFSVDARRESVSTPCVHIPMGTCVKALKLRTRTREVASNTTIPAVSATTKKRPNERLWIGRPGCAPRIVSVGSVWRTARTDGRFAATPAKRARPTHAATAEASRWAEASNPWGAETRSAPRNHTPRGKPKAPAITASVQLSRVIPRIKLAGGAFRQRIIPFITLHGFEQLVPESYFPTSLNVATETWGQ